MAQFTLVDLFAGAGGITRGFVNTRKFRSVLAVEKDADARASYIENFHKRDPENVLDDVTGLTRSDLPKKFDVLVGGPPCQDFTQLTAVRQQVNRDRNDLLWTHYINLVLASKPPVFVIENVGNLLTAPEHEQQRNTLKEKVEGADYKVAWGLLTASNFGLPQARQRAFIIGSLRRQPYLPLPTLRSETAWERLRSLSLIRPGRAPDQKSYLSGTGLHVGRESELLSRLRYRYVLPEGNRMHLPTPLTIKTWVYKKSGTSDGYGRVYPFRPSSTIRCEGFKPEKGRFLHPFENRPLTLAEMARLQTFPDEHVFYGSCSSIAHQIGNAVPPDMAMHIAEVVANLLAPESIEVEVPAKPRENPVLPGFSGASAVERIKGVLQRSGGQPLPWWVLEEVAKGDSGTQAVDWGAPLMTLVDAGYHISAGPAEGLPLGYYRLEERRVPPAERSNVRRLLEYEIARRGKCDECGDSFSLKARFVRDPDSDGLLLADNVEVLCGQHWADLPLRMLSRKEEAVYAWLARYRHYFPVATELFQAVGLRSDEVTQGPLPQEYSSLAALTAECLAASRKCTLCDREPDDLQASLIRPTAEQGLLVKENVWVLCRRCRAELQSQLIKVPSHEPIEGLRDEGMYVPLESRFSEPGFLTLDEAYYRNWLLLFRRDPEVRKRAQKVLLTGKWTN